ncbi:glucanase [Phytohabitans rumicis]|uniref:Glucanase n=1 Tax=Phytohabitans rumicis TaxID=1076125 RepID=A0A6V8LB84_9ACTN|nr:glucanase [Phytohabitans rumicis]
MLGLGGLSVIQALPASAAPGCSVTYTIANQWNNGFQGNIVIRNVGDAWTSWTLRFSFANGQTVSQGWTGRFSQSGSAVTVANETWNGAVATGGSVNPGFIGTHTGTNAVPTSFSVNNTVCTGTVTPTTGTPTTNPTTGTPTTSPTTGTPTTGPTGNPGPKADNPYAGGTGYVNPEWRAKANSVSGGSRISNNPTAVWIDRIAAINGTPDSSSNGPMGVRAHLDAALAQGASYIQFVIYNLPGRDCAALASNGELTATEIGRYRTEYIDPIRAIQADAKYAGLRIINIIEIDSLPNLITNVSGRAGATAACDTMKANGNYQTGIAYALQRLGSIGNVYNYVDAAHHGWIGWDDNFTPTAQLLAQVADLSGSKANVHGFITNTANYSALQEPYITVNDTTRPSAWIDWNRYNDELSFAQAFRTALVGQGFASSLGMLIDTSRNGWGGTARPTGPVTTGTINDQVNGSRIDRRIHKGNWCNQSGAGLGERPRSAPAAGIDAYVWVKPPGESDGSSTLIPNTEGKGFDRMCDPTYTGNARNGNSMSGALSGAPISGAWFPAQVTQLMQNAYPAL